MQFSELLLKYQELESSNATLREELMRMESYVAGYADTIRSINEQLSTATAEVERLRGALGKLAKQLRVVTDSPEYLAVWHLYWAHGGNYSGPRYKEELETAESMLEEAALKGE